MEKILQAGRLAPTAKNSQSQRIFVLKSPEALKKINEATPMAFNAPVVLMVCYDQNESYKNAADTAYTYYPAADAEPSPRHSDRKPLDETVKYL